MQAAFALYGERGFEQTTVAEIAERAGLTERTFFRHFADKREVLFAGADELQKLLVTAVAEAPDSATPIDAAAAGLEAAGALDPGGRSAPETAAGHHCRKRGAAGARADQALVTGLRARGTLRRRGVVEPAASLAAEAGIAVFRIAFEQWIGDTGRQSLPSVIRGLFDELRSVVGAQPSLPGRGVAGAAS